MVVKIRNSRATGEWVEVRLPPADRGKSKVYSLCLFVY